MLAFHLFQLTNGEFQKWLAVDVIPTLRKTGIYEIGTVKTRNDIGQISYIIHGYLLLFSLEGNIVFRISFPKSQITLTSVNQDSLYFL